MPTPSDAPLVAAPEAAADEPARKSARKTVAKRPRDPRLDFFRGVGMLIILIAHVPGNPWILWIPARFGFSDATEMFVFCSGMASAIAFGRIFDSAGFGLGIARVAQRCWQVYWAHVAVFIVVATLLAVAGLKPDGSSYISSLNLQHFFERPAEQLPGLLTLTYVPNYFDILPMYLVILAMMPVMLAAERVHRFAAVGLMAAIWLAAQVRLLDLPAEPWSDRIWYFNPFGWQLLFFLGFFLMRGTLAAPGYDRRIMQTALVVIAATVPFAWYVTLEAVPQLRAVADLLLPLTDKTHFGILRLVHFLALAYVAVHLVGEGGRRLTGRVVEVVKTVGRQSLAVFIAGMVGAQAIGIALDHTDRDPAAVAVANLMGFAMLVATAYLVEWLKSSPWSKPAAREGVDQTKKSSRRQPAPEA